MSFIFLGNEPKIKAPFISVLETEWKNQCFPKCKKYEICMKTYFFFHTSEKLLQRRVQSEKSTDQKKIPALKKKKKDDITGKTYTKVRSSH